MFRNLPVAQQPDDALVALGESMAEPKGRENAPAQDNTNIGAGYTYLGQFIDHDITFDPASHLQQLNDPDALHDFRSPRYDLDSLYGRGPADEPFLYESQDERFRGVKLLIGRNPANQGLEPDDLLRNRQGRAIIGDPRNDENIIIGQLELAFVRFHNRTVDLIAKQEPALKGSALFEEARRVATWHYQWVVVRDFLPRVVGSAMANDVFTPGGPPNLQFFHWVNDPFMPVEFSAAAYRFGHSMVRAIYDLNDVVTQVPLFAVSAKPGPLEHLGGFRPLPEAWTIDWRRFVRNGAATPQFSRNINTKLSRPLMELPINLDVARHPLAVLNLRRGKALELPSGQSVAQAMSQTPLPASKLALGGRKLSSAQQTALEAETPLWYYVLREAETAPMNGKRLGPVGGRIVAEVLVGLLQGDPLSFLSVNPQWRPGRIPGAKKGEFSLGDLLKFATM
jgi:hypothetical protein